MNRFPWNKRNCPTTWLKCFFLLVILLPASSPYFTNYTTTGICNILQAQNSHFIYLLYVAFRSEIENTKNSWNVMYDHFLVDELVIKYTLCHWKWGQTNSSEKSTARICIFFNAIPIPLSHFFELLRVLNEHLHAHLHLRLLETEVQ